jgi:hypothetical protein
MSAMKLRMRLVAAGALLAALSVVLPVRAKAQDTGTGAVEYGRQTQIEYAKQQKIAKKNMKKQMKAMKKSAKAQRKAQKKNTPKNTNYPAK